jgi:hypothetical protein
MAYSSTNPLVRTITAFLDEIGLSVEPGNFTEDTFLPGIKIRNGKILINEAALSYPGDILHEAGHLAVVPAGERASLNDNVGGNGGDEMAAIAWSWAAALHLSIPLEVVFHEGGYRGGSQAIIENFSVGQYFGVPILEWVGMTYDKARARELGVAPFPRMVKWLRE